MNRALPNWTLYIRRRSCCCSPTLSWCWLITSLCAVHGDAGPRIAIGSIFVVTIVRRDFIIVRLMSGGQSTSVG